MRTPLGRSQRLLEGFDRVLFCNADLELPNEPGVYFVTTRKGFILYIGMSEDMRNRWKDGHHRALECMRAGAQYIYYQFTAEPQDLEPLYIEEYDPPINGARSTNAIKK